MGFSSVPFPGVMFYFKWILLSKSKQSVNDGYLRPTVKESISIFI